MSGLARDIEHVSLRHGERGARGERVVPARELD